MTENIASAMIGAIVGFIASALTLRFSYKQLFAQTVSKNRMDWINNFREELSIVVGTAKYLNYINQQNNYSDIEGNTYQPSEQVLSAEKARIKLLTRLNTNSTKEGNEYHDLFAEMINMLEFKGNDNLSLIKNIEETAKLILEPEWKRVKKEAKGDA